MRIFYGVILAMCLVDAVCADHGGIEISPPSITVEYTEPHEYVGGTPGRDLRSTVFVVTPYHANQVLDPSLAVEYEFPASAPTGGGQMTETFELPVLPEGMLGYHIVFYPVKLDDTRGQASLPRTVERAMLEIFKRGVWGHH